MLWLPPAYHREVQNNLSATPQLSLGPNVTASAVAHTKGTWSQLLASTNFETEWAVVVLAGTSEGVTNTSSLVDIGVGAALSEQVVLPDLMGGWASTGVSTALRMFSGPVYIPKGLRIAARAQSVEASKTIPTAIWLYGGARHRAISTFSRCDPIGISAATSNGTSVTAGSTGVYGAWTNVGLATARPYKALWFALQGTLTIHTLLYYHFQVGFNSTPIGSEFWAATTTNEQVAGPVPPEPIYHAIPTGTQLQVRGKCSGTAEALSVGLYGLY